MMTGVGAGNSANVGWNGSEFIVSQVWRTGAVYATRVDISTMPATVGTPELLPGTASWEDSSISSGVDPLLFAFMGDGADINAVRFDSIAGPLDTPPIVVGTASNRHADVHVESNGTDFLVVWTDTRLDREEIVAIRVGGDGTILDSAPFRVGDYGLAFSRRVLAVVARGSEYSVFYPDGTGIRFQRISPAGSLIGGALLVPGPSGFGGLGGIASDGNNFFIAGSDSRGVVQGFRFDPAGTRLDATMLRFGRAANDVEVAGTPGMFFVASMQRGNSVMVSRVLSDGTLLDSPGLRLFFGSRLIELSVASDGTDVLVAWPDDQPAAVDHFVVGSRMTRAGVSLDPVPFPLDAREDMESVELSFDGTEYVSTYTRRFGDKLATFVAPDGTIGTGSPHVINPGLGYWSSSVASTSSGQSLIAYLHLVGGAVRNPRVRLRHVTRGPADGTPCAMSAECASGFCTDDVCCDTACGASAPDDCQACAVAAGASVDGACEVLPATRGCRPSADVCDAAETCDGASAACPTDASVADGTSCDDALVCNGEQICVSGACTAGSPLVCDDTDACTTDVCAEPGGCLSTAIVGCCHEDEGCDDGAACTADTCVASECASVPIPGCCEAAPDCEDADICTADACDVATGICSRTDIADCCRTDLDCDDGDACTNDRCDVAAGVCTSDGIASCCLDSSDCDDGDACTLDACAGDACTHEPDPTCERSGGCSCRIEGRPSNRLVWLVGLVAMLVFGQRRTPRR